MDTQQTQEPIKVEQLSPLGMFVLKYLALSAAREEHRLRLKRLELPPDDLSRDLRRAAAVILNQLSKELQVAAPSFDDTKLNDYEAALNQWLAVHYQRCPEDKLIFDQIKARSGNCWFTFGCLRWWQPIVEGSLEEYAHAKASGSQGAVTL